MNQGGYVTLVGYVAREPAIRHTNNGTPVADMRLGTASRYFDKATETWKDGDQSYFTVTFWRKLATYAQTSLRKGDPVIVRGRFRTRSYQGKDGHPRTEIEVTAEAFGHDLTRGVATFMHDRQRDASRAQAGQDQDDEEGGQEQDQGGQVPDDSPSPEGAAATAADADALADQLLNENAVARFSEGLADDGALARELTGTETSAHERADGEAEEPNGAAVPY